MEKTMSIEEKIRKAEEIYYRRNLKNQNVNLRENQSGKKGCLKFRLIKQLIICSIVYVIFYVSSNKEYFVSTEFLNTVEELVSKNELLEKEYYKIKNYINNSFFKENKHLTEQEQPKDDIIEQKESLEFNNQNQNENIGGSNQEIVEEDKRSQEEKDIEEIKNTIDFINPIDGTISSTFGWRNPSTKTVPKYHTGLDIAAPKGTIIKAATDGKIILASSKGDYGNHYKIQIEDIIIIYAHCNKLYLNEGEEVKKGQNIAEVGSTGNSTGPHLHFEIRKQGRLINPQDILEF